MGGELGSWPRSVASAASGRVRSDGEITDFVQAPFTFHEVRPEIPQSLEIGGITEVIATS